MTCVHYLNDRCHLHAICHRRFLTGDHECRVRGQLTWDLLTEPPPTEYLIERVSEATKQKEIEKRMKR